VLTCVAFVLFTNYAGLTMLSCMTLYVECSLFVSDNKQLNRIYSSFVLFIINDTHAINTSDINSEISEFAI